MSTDTLHRSALVDVGSPWRRLHWTLPLALAICALAFALFSISMEREAPRPAEPLPVDAQLVELPSTPTPHTAPVHTPPPPQPAAQQEALPQADKAPPATTPQPAQAPAPAANPNHTARTLSQPMPVIPDELRDEAMHERAIARFNIAADGRVSVKLIKPTQNPQLNRLLLETLRRWKFEPAIQDGQAVPSTQDIAIRVQVD